MITRAISAAASGLREKITSTTATLVRESATTMPMEDAENAAATNQPGRPIVVTARRDPRRSRHQMRAARLVQADTDRQNTVVQACGWSSPRTKSPPVLKIRADIATNATANPDPRDAEPCAVSCPLTPTVLPRQREEDLWLGGRSTVAKVAGSEEDHMNVIWPLIHAERKALAADLEGLTEAQWESPSLCTEWTIRDVVAHRTATAKMTPAQGTRVPTLRSTSPAARQNIIVQATIPTMLTETENPIMLRTVAKFGTVTEHKTNNPTATNNIP